MSEPEKRDHWADLADLVGAQPSPKQEGAAEPTVPPPAEPVVEQAPAPAPRRPEPPRREPVDWGRLAAELGLALAPEPAAAPAATPEPVAEASLAESDEPLADLEAEEHARVRAEAWQSQLVEVSDPVFLDTADEEEPPALEGSEPAIEGEAVAEEQATSDSGGPAEQGERGERRRRRKKRRRRKSGEGAARGEQGAGGESGAEVAASVPVDAGPAEQYLETVLSGDSTAEAADSGEAMAEAASEGERREGRKRRRRRRKKRSGEPSAAAAESSTDESQSDISAESTAEDDDDAEAEHDDIGLEHDGVDGDEGDESSGRLSHRAIPTWDQAIGLMIARNMEARAKHPNGPSRRGGKGRRPDRGRS